MNDAELFDDLLVAADFADPEPEYTLQPHPLLSVPFYRRINASDAENGDADTSSGDESDLSLDELASDDDNDGDVRNDAASDNDLEQATASPPTPTLASAPVFFEKPLDQVAEDETERQGFALDRIPDHLKLVEVGRISSIHNEFYMIQSEPLRGENIALDIGSVLVFGDRHVLGPVRRFPYIFSKTIILFDRSLRHSAGSISHSTLFERRQIEQ